VAFLPLLSGGRGIRLPRKKFSGYRTNQNENDVGYKLYNESGELYINYTIRIIYRNGKLAI
jgi:hypothetical protein